MSQTVFHATEEQDEKIIELGDSVKHAMGYMVNGEPQLSLQGYRYVSDKRRAAGHAFKVVDKSIVLVKHNTEDQKQWVWYAEITLQDTKDGNESFGVSEQSYLQYYFKDGQKVFSSNYDEFGRTKAVGKAKRNAMRDQLPLTDVQKTLAVFANEIKDISLGQKQAPYQKQPQNTPITEKQKSYLKVLGYKGELPTTSNQASDLIKELKEKQ